MKTIPSERQTIDRAGIQAREQELVAEILAFLAREPDRLSAFFETTGIAAASLRERVEEPSFRRGLLDYLVSDDGLLVAFAAFAGRAPERAALDIERFRHPVSE